MIELVRKTPTTLHEFIDLVDDFVKVEDTLPTIIALRKLEVV